MRFPRPPLSTPHAAVAALVASAAVAVGCGTGGAEGSDAEVTAVATTTHVADLVRNVGGDRVEVEQFLTAGADPHEYEPRPSDAQAVAESAVVFQSGGDLDSWLGGVVENAGGDGEVVTLIDATETIAGGHGEDEEHADGEPHAEGEAHGEEEHAEDEAGAGAEPQDPHWWQDPRNAVAAVQAIADALADADPEDADAYRRNADAYIERLEGLDSDIAACMQRVPDEQRKLVTTHDAYGYFAERYDVEVVGALIPSQSTEAQPSSGEVAALIEQIEDEGVEAIFPQSPLNPELEEAVAEEAGAEVGDPLWADSLGPEGSGGSTYVDALASDAAAMVEGFSGGEVTCEIDA